LVIARLRRGSPPLTADDAGADAAGMCASSIFDTA
jgi:hypothetical protein